MTTLPKFRAWDKQEKKMYYLDQTFIGVGQLGFSDTHYIDLSYEDTVINKQDVDVMQWVGLSDKNKKDIYDGDIIKVYNELRVVSFMTAFWSTLTPEDYYKKFGYKDILPAGFGTLMDEGEDETYKSFKPLYRYSKPEVLGNIYENPDLLSPKEK